MESWNTSCPPLPNFCRICKSCQEENWSDQMIQNCHCSLVFLQHFLQVMATHKKRWEVILEEYFLQYFLLHLQDKSSYWGKKKKTLSKIKSETPPIQQQAVTLKSQPREAKRSQEPCACKSTIKKPSRAGRGTFEYQRCSLVSHYKASPWKMGKFRGLCPETA